MEGQKFLTINRGYLLILKYLNVEIQYTVYNGLHLRPEKIFTKRGIPLNAGTNWDFTTLLWTGILNLPLQQFICKIQTYSHFLTIGLE
jgi:hypothetical protein